MFSFISLKRVVTFGVLLSSSLLIAQNTPPMPPMAGANNPIKNADKLKLPKECSTVPPMIIFLPPPLEEAYYQCKNSLYLPKKEDAETKLSKLLNEKIKITSIDVVNGFTELYGIEIVDSKNIVRSYYCNRFLTKCILNIKTIE